MNDLITCHNCDTQGTPETLTELSPNVYECDQCWLTAGGDELTPLDQVSSKDLTNAILLTIDWLTDNNVHTLAALLEWNAADMIELYTDKTTAQYDANAMIQAYKAAQLIISGTQ